MNRVRVGKDFRIKVAGRQDGGNAVAVLDFDEVDDGEALGLLFRIRNVVAAEVVDLAFVGEEEEVVVAVADDKLHDGVFFADLSAA